MTPAPVDQPAIYQFESDASGFNTKTLFYDNGEEVVAFDAQFTPDLAKKAIEFLRTKTKNPISHLVITHPNPDKFNGIGEFQKAGAKVVASKKTTAAIQTVHDYKKYFFVNLAKMFTEETYPKLGQVNLEFDQSLQLKLKSGETISLLELQRPGVSTHQTVAYIASVNSLIVGDLVHHRAHAWLEGGIVAGKPVPTLRGWIEDLQELQQKFLQKDPVVYGGRGEVASLKIAVPEQIRYLERADEIVKNYVQSLGARKSELTGEKAAQHHANLQNEFVKEFPLYKLDYMIGYGVYGLANSKL